MSLTSSKNLTVQIVNFGTKEYLRRCLRSSLAALEGTPGSHGVSVLNNGSEENLSDLAADFSGEVDFYESPVNKGFGGGHNLLATKNNSPFLCFANPDIVVRRRGDFARLLSLFDDEAIAVAGPQLVSESGDPQRWDHGELRGFRARIANGVGHAHWRPRDAPVEAAWVAGAFMIIRRDAFEAVGGFDEAYFLYKEDEDLCLQIRRLGQKVIYDPRVQVTHVGSVVARRDAAHFERSVEHFIAKNIRGPWRWRPLRAMYTNVLRHL